LAAATVHRTDTAGGLDVRLDAPLPRSLAVGSGTAVFVCGTCVAPGSLSLLVDGSEQALMAYGMPRAGERAGFWGMARIGPREPGDVVELGLRSGELVAEVGRIPVAEPPAPVPGAPLVAIAMATFEPPIDLFRRQIDSIKGQTLNTQFLNTWVCVISDDCSDPARFAELQRVVGDDERFVVSRSERRRGFYHNFERALELVPAGARYVALADQDDVWDPDKLETLVGEIGDARLIYSDQRIVEPRGEQVAATYWSQRANNHADMLSLLVANCVTGAASLFPRALLDDALPLPPAQFGHYHDHWLALTALALGEIRYVPRPLYDYVQHEQATLGHATATRMVRLRDRLSSLRRGVRERVRLWRFHYFADACRLQHFATVLELRCGARMSAGKRRALGRILRAERSALPLPGLFARGARELARRRPETLAAEWMLGYAFTWRRLVAATGGRLDALPPPSLRPSPRVRVPGDPDLRALAESLLPLRLAVADDAPERVNLLVTSVDAESAPAHLARRLAERGVPVRTVPVELGREIEVSRSDAFVATDWRTAHLAHAAAERFVYLIREYEPLAYPAGTLAALAAESYTFPHFALYSSELLREYFRERGVGARESAAFEEAVTVPPPSEPRFARRLLFHGEGPLFELGVLALGRALERGALAGWTLDCIGAARPGRRLDLGGGDWMRLLPAGPLPPGYDVGLALVHAPQPGRVPLEMARAGMVAVTTTFENKTADALAAISANLVAAAPTVDGIAQGLAAAAEAAGDVERRARGSAIRWSTDWDASFGDEVLDRLTDFLR
jgi:glycosyltransferase involved in cell wall biosynthesis